MDDRTNKPSGDLPHPADMYSADDCEPVEMDMGASDEEQPPPEEDVARSTEAYTQSSTDKRELSPVIGDGHDNAHHKIRHETDRNGARHHDADGRHHHRDRDEKAASSSARSSGTNIVHVINISPSVSIEQLRALFTFVGDLLTIELYQATEPTSGTDFKVCFVEFAKPSSVLLAQHLTNTVLVDRALIVLPYYKREIPDKETAIALTLDMNLVTHFDPGVVSHIVNGPGGAQMIATTDSKFTTLGLQQYPHLPINTEPARVEEIRRTVYIGNLDSTVHPDDVMNFFNSIGEVKYIRMAGDDTQPSRFAFVEYTHQTSLANAVQHNGSTLGSRQLKINHSNNSIVKPPPKIEDIPLAMRDNRSTSRDYGSRDRNHSSRRHERDRMRDYDRDRTHRRRGSPRDSRSRRSRSREGTSRRSRSRDQSRRSKSRERNSHRQSSKSGDSRRRRSGDRSKSRHHKSSRR